MKLASELEWRWTRFGRHLINSITNDEAPARNVAIFVHFEPSWCTAMCRMFQSVHRDVSRISRTYVAIPPRVCMLVEIHSTFSVALLAGPDLKTLPPTDPPNHVHRCPANIFARPTLPKTAANKNNPEELEKDGPEEPVWIHLGFHHRDWAALDLLDTELRSPARPQRGYRFRARLEEGHPQRVHPRSRRIPRPFRSLEGKASSEGRHSPGSAGAEGSCRCRIRSRGKPGSQDPMRHCRNWIRARQQTVHKPSECEWKYTPLEVASGPDGHPGNRSGSGRYSFLRSEHRS